jgi:hypothetical protein
MIKQKNFLCYAIQHQLPKIKSSLETLVWKYSSSLKTIIKFLKISCYQKVSWMVMDLNILIFLDN